MIIAKKHEPSFRVEYSNGTHRGYADVAVEKGGNGHGFRPHDLLEASLAVCLNMTVRMYAKEHGIALADVEARVQLDRSDREIARFHYELTLSGDITESERDVMIRAASCCPVSQTLSRRIIVSPTTRPL